MSFTIEVPACNGCCGCPGYLCPQDHLPGSGESNPTPHWVEGVCIGGPASVIPTLAQAQAFTGFTFPSEGVMRLETQFYTPIAGGVDRMFHVLFWCKFKEGDHIKVDYSMACPAVGDQGGFFTWQADIHFLIHGFNVAGDHQFIPDPSNMAAPIVTGVQSHSHLPFNTPAEQGGSVISANLSGASVSDFGSVSVSSSLGLTLQNLNTSGCYLLKLRWSSNTIWAPPSGWAEIELRDSEGELVSWLSRIREATPPEE